MISGLAHTGVCVPDVEAATEWYRDVLGLHVLSPPFLMEGDALAADMGELIAERTIWFTDPWGVVFILVEKSRPDRPYFAQWG